MLDQVPPNSTEAEQAVLGAILLQPDTLAHVEFLKPEHFYRKSHQIIYSAIVTLSRKGQAVDHITVAQYLKDKKQLENCGGRQYLVDLVMCVSTTANMEHYGKTVYDKAMLRRLIKDGTELVEACYKDDAEGAVDKAKGLLTDVEKRERNTNLATMSLSELMRQSFEAPRWAVEDLLPEGLTVLAGAPKLGKSWMALQIALAVSRGERVLGDYMADEGEVLYLALEDSFRRLQQRVTMVADDRALADNSNLILCTELPGMESGGVAALEQWLEQHPKCRLVIIDTLAKFIPPTKEKTNAYQSDYVNYGRLQRMALKHRIALMGVHHVRKMKATDALDEVSGSSGVTGAADAIWVLKRARTENTGTLLVTGRDIDEMQLTTEFDKETCRWAITGDARGQQRRELLIKLSSAFGNQPFTCNGAMDVLGISLAHAKRQVNALHGAGYLVRLEEKIGKAYQFRLTDRLADQFLGGAA